MQMLLDGKVQAAILPTPFVNQRKAQGADVRVVLLTEPIPNLALSTGPSMTADVREGLRKALLQADKSDAGRAMLRAMGTEKFEPATAAIYTGQSRILEEYWGY
jgi:ABC-type phosphate/phosphonate transport system substrate-binding protein